MSGLSNLADIISWQGLVRGIGCYPMSNTPTFASYEQGLISLRLEQVRESCGLLRDEVLLLLSVPRSLSGNAELQFIELIEHLTVLVGRSSAAQSDWLTTTNLDLGQTPLLLIKAPRVLEHVRDYLAGQRYRC
jgi:hypothetical protein